MEGLLKRTVISQLPLTKLAMLFGFFLWNKLNRIKFYSLKFEKRNISPLDDIYFVL